MEDFILFSYIFIVGTMLGSFINCAAYRIPLKLSVIMPGSFCTNCKTPIKWFHNIPVLSWFFLHGKCATCRVPFSFRYPAIELLFGFLLLGLFLQNGGFCYEFFSLALLSMALVTIFLIDLDHYIIPDLINFPLLAIGFLYAWFVKGDVVDGLIGGVGGFAFFLFLFLMTKGRGMGFGDVKMIAMLGIWFGWLQTFFIIMISSLLGSLVGAAMMLYGKAKMKTALPYGTFLAIAAVLMIFCGDSLIEAYRSILP